MKLSAILPFLVFSLLPYVCSAQVWIEENAEWHYDYWNIGTGGFYKMEYTQDTLVGGKLCQQIETKKYSFGSDQFGTIQLLDSMQFPHQFTYVDGDTVFYWNDDQFFTLFNFGASIGDQWQIGAFNPQAQAVCLDSSFVEVVDVGSISIQSSTYRTITLETVDSSAIGLQGTFVERFGFLDSNQPFLPFPRWMNCNGDIVEYDFLTFKCYQDDSFSLYNPSGEDCEYYLTHLGWNELNNTNVRVYPNPFDSHIEASNLTEGTLFIYDLQGSAIKSLLYSTNQKIDLSFLKNGMYLLDFEDYSGSTIRVRALKTESE